MKIDRSRLSAATRNGYNTLVQEIRDQNLTVARLSNGFDTICTQDGKDWVMAPVLTMRDEKQWKRDRKTFKTINL